MKHTKNLSVSIVIPALNEEWYLARCLDSIMQYKTDDLKEIIIVDNGSSDHTVRVAKKYPDVKVLRFDHPLGLPRAREPGFAKAGGDLIASLDADTMISEHWFAEMQRAFSENPACICISGPYHYFDAPLPVYAALRILDVLISYPFLWLFKYRIIGGNFVVRSNALNKVNLFEYSTKFWGEDSTIGECLKKVGPMKYVESFYVFASARRWKKEGFFILGWKYLVSLLFQGFLHRPLNNTRAAAVR